MLFYVTLFGSYKYNAEGWMDTYPFVGFTISQLLYPVNVGDFMSLPYFTLIIHVIFSHII